MKAIQQTAIFKLKELIPNAANISLISINPDDNSKEYRCYDVVLSFNDNEVQKKINVKVIESNGMAHSVNILD